jgi:sigma-E factor negative regulatory protein RseB
MVPSAEVVGRGRIRRVPAWFAACALLGGACLGGAALAQVPGPAASPTPDAAAQREARSWLLRIQEAPAKRSFQGTFVVTAGGAVTSARIAHYQVGANQYEKIESLDGQSRHVYRHNDLIHTLWPRTRVAMVEQRDKLGTFPTLLQGGDQRVVDQYEVKVVGADRVAGHEAQVIDLVPRDALRFGYQLWAEKDSGLLLRADVLNERGERLESSAFSDVVIGVKPQADQVLQAMKKLDGYRVLRPTLNATELEQEGWVERHPVPGFRKLRCFKRPLDAGGEVEPAERANQVLQTIYSDGLTYVSVFIEAYNAQRHPRPMLASIGATHTLTLRRDEWWFTVVGDVPPAALRAFAKGIERSR